MTIPSELEIMRREESMITFDQWSKEVSKTISFQNEECQKNLNNPLLLADDDFEDEDSGPNQPKKK